MIQKIKKIISKHKVISAVSALVVIVIIYLLVRGSGGTAASQYVLASVQKGTIISSISGSGQISASNQVDVKPKVSGDVVYVGVKNGQAVRAGTLLVQLNTQDALKAIRDAEISLENAQISLQKTKLSQSSSIPQLQDTITNAQSNLGQAYQNGFNGVANAFLDLPDISTGIRGILYDAKVGSSTQANTGAYRDLMDQYSVFQMDVMIYQSAGNYQTAAAKFSANFDNYKNTSRYSSPEQIIVLINETLETVKLMAQTVKDEQNILDTVVLSMKQYQTSRPIPSAITQYQSDIAGYVSKLNSHINTLANIQNSITSNQQNLASAQRNFSNAQQSNPLDLASQQIAVQQRQAVLQDAKDNLANYYVRAPFAGTVAAVNIKRGDSASGGTAAVTVISNQRIAEISLNEVDVAKIKIDQKVTLTFDAVENLTITGKVADVDIIGAVSQGVVSYNIKIGLDAEDSRIKPGMSVSASIITDSKQNVLMVPLSAIKTSSDFSYVEMPSEASSSANELLAQSASSAGIVLDSQPKRQTITVGLISDSYAEITDGLKEGDVIVTRTITSSTASTQSSTQNRSILNAGGGTRGLNGSR
ncbi:MAG: Uncharacterized protein CEN90_202 [Parcubacteria group bacterium Licking1014_17]|nr:MAG: Uncharacterized protein CEN90_202 [Parcubacteria group bacterium Licking1014_17]